MPKLLVAGTRRQYQTRVGAYRGSTKTHPENPRRIVLELESDRRSDPLRLWLILIDLRKLQRRLVPAPYTVSTGLPVLPRLLQYSSSYPYDSLSTSLS
eukprot:2022571-Rhodomonas_salina.1